MADTINILMSTNDSYAVWCGICLQSIINTSKHNIHAYILADGISTANKDLLVSLSSSTINISILDIDINSIINADIPFSERLPKIAFARLFAANLLPNVDKIIYLDPDTIVKQDLYKLWETNLSDKYIVAGVPDNNSTSCLQYLNLNGIYVNAGVLLMDLNKIRQQNIEKLFRITTRDNFNKLRFFDQDVLNIALNNRILPLPQKWNVAVYKQNDLIPQDIGIIHFIWGGKPWKYSSTNIFKSEFWNVVRNSSWINLYHKYVSYKTDNYKNILISIIMPCYNCTAYLKDAIESVLEQSFVQWELIIIDDGSTDNSATIADEYAQKDKRIKVIRQENSGVISARNNGIRSARGKYIYPLDADDKIAPNCLDLLYKTISETNCAVAACEVEKFGTQSGQFVFPGAPTKSNMYQYNCICNGSLFAKSDWDKYGGYDSQFERGLEDYDFWLNFIDDNRIITRIPKILYYYRIKSGDLSRNNIAMKSHDDLMRKLRNKHKNIIVYSIYRKIKSIFYKRTKRHVYILSIPIKRI